MTPEQQALMTQAYESQRAARLLLEHELFRFAVSRAYYTMFYVASAILQAEGLEFAKHSAVIAAFGQHFTRTGRIPPEFHRYLIDGEDSRIDGDYKYMLQITQEQAAQQLEWADKFIAMGEKFFNSTSPSSSSEPPSDER